MTPSGNLPDVPRIPFEDLPEDLAHALRPRFERLGYLGEFFQVGAHQPEALGHFVRFTESLKSALPERLSELVALTVSSKLQNAYERVQHERLSLKLGFSQAWIRQVEDLAPDESDLLEADERAAQVLVLSIVESLGQASSQAATEFVALVGPEVLVGVLLATGRYLAHAALCNTIGIEAPFRSPLGEES
jgi:alkylhydroperoxidase family enzyme